MNNFISFVIPAYNAEKTLAEAVDSVVLDNFIQGDEVIIVNDASTDNTELVAKKLTEKYFPHVTLITNDTNKGCPASRNIGIRTSKNSLIFNLDSDNILEVNSISKLKKVLVDETIDVVAFERYNYFKDDIRKLTHIWICKSGIFTLADIFSGMINPAPGGNYLYRKALWERVGGYWEYGRGLHEAWGFSLKILLASARFYVVPGTYYFHRHSHQSLFVTENKKIGEGMAVSNKFMVPALHLLSVSSINYIQNNPDWFTVLDTHPLSLKNGLVGTNGTVHMVSYSYQFLSFLRKIKNYFLTNQKQPHA